MAKRGRQAESGAPLHQVSQPLSPRQSPTPAIWSTVHQAAGAQAPGLGLQGTGSQPPGQVAGAFRGVIEDNVRAQPRVLGPGVWPSPWTEGYWCLCFISLQPSEDQCSCGASDSALGGQSLHAVPGHHLHGCADRCFKPPSSYRPVPSI